MGHARKTADNVTRTADNVRRTVDNVTRTADNVIRTADNVRRTAVNVGKTADNVRRTADNVRKTVYTNTVRNGKVNLLVKLRIAEVGRDESKGGNITTQFHTVTQSRECHFEKEEEEIHRRQVHDLDLWSASRD